MPGRPGCSRPSRLSSTTEPEFFGQTFEVENGDFVGHIFSEFLKPCIFCCISYFPIFCVFIEKQVDFNYRTI